MQNLTAGQGKAIRLMALAMLPFIAFFIFELVFVLPHRPLAADVVHGYTIPLGLDRKTVYITIGDLILTFGAVVCPAVVCVSTFWRIGLLKQILRR